MNTHDEARATADALRAVDCEDRSAMIDVIERAERALRALLQTPTAHGAGDERARIEQSNDAAGIVVDVIHKLQPGLFVTLDLRYGIADALWVAGYRKHPEPEWQYRYATNERRRVYPPGPWTPVGERE